MPGSVRLAGLRAAGVAAVGGNLLVWPFSKRSNCAAKTKPTTLRPPRTESAAVDWMCGSLTSSAGIFCLFCPFFSRCFAVCFDVCFLWCFFFSDFFFFFVYTYINRVFSLTPFYLLLSFFLMYTHYTAPFYCRLAWLLLSSTLLASATWSQIGLMFSCTVAGAS